MHAEKWAIDQENFLRKAVDQQRRTGRALATATARATAAHGIVTSGAPPREAQQMC